MDALLALILVIWGCWVIMFLIFSGRVIQLLREIRDELRRL